MLTSIFVCMCVGISIAVVNSQSCPQITNVAEFCVPGEYSGARVLIDMSSQIPGASCMCKYNTTAQILRAVTYNAPNYQQCNTAVRMIPDVGSSLRFQCLVTGTYLDTSVSKSGLVTLETYTEPSDHNYCLVLQHGGAFSDSVTVTCTGPDEPIDYPTTVSESQTTTTAYRTTAGPLPETSSSLSPSSTALPIVTSTATDSIATADIKTTTAGMSTTVQAKVSTQQRATGVASLTSNSTTQITSQPEMTTVYVYQPGGTTSESAWQTDQTTRYPPDSVPNMGVTFPTPVDTIEVVNNTNDTIVKMLPSSPQETLVLNRSLSPGPDVALLTSPTETTSIPETTVWTTKAHSSQLDVKLSRSTTDESLSSSSTFTDAPAGEASFSFTYPPTTHVPGDHISSIDQSSLLSSSGSFTDSSVPGNSVSLTHSPTTYVPGERVSGSFNTQTTIQTPSISSANWRSSSNTGMTLPPRDMTTPWESSGMTETKGVYTDSPLSTPRRQDEFIHKMTTETPVTQSAPATTPIFVRRFDAITENESVTSKENIVTTTLGHLYIESANGTTDFTSQPDFAKTVSFISHAEKTWNNFQSTGAPSTAAEAMSTDVTMETVPLSSTTASAIEDNIRTNLLSSILGSAKNVEMHVTAINASQLEGTSTSAYQTSTTETILLSTFNGSQSDFAKGSWSEGNMFKSPVTVANAKAGNVPESTTPVVSKSSTFPSESQTKTDIHSTSFVDNISTRSEVLIPSVEVNTYVPQAEMTQFVDAVTNTTNKFAPTTVADLTERVPVQNVFAVNTASKVVPVAMDMTTSGEVTETIAETRVDSKFFVEPPAMDAASTTSVTMDMTTADGVVETFAETKVDSTLFAEPDDNNTAPEITPFTTDLSTVGGIIETVAKTRVDSNLFAEPDAIDFAAKFPPVTMDMTTAAGVTEIFAETRVDSNPFEEPVFGNETQTVTTKRVSVVKDKTQPLQRSDTATIKAETATEDEHAKTTLPTNKDTVSTITTVEFNKAEGVNTVPLSEEAITSTTRPVAEDTMVVQNVQVLKVEPIPAEVRPTTRGNKDVTIVDKDTTRLGSKDPVDNTGGMNVALEDEIPESFFDMNNNKYIIVVGCIAALVVLAVIVGLIINHTRKHRSEKVNIANNGAGDVGQTNPGADISGSINGKEAGTNGPATVNGKGAGTNESATVNIDI